MKNRSEDVWERWTSRLVWFVMVTAMVGGAGWMTSYNNALRAQKAEIRRITDVSNERQEDIDVSIADLPPSAIPWIHAFERVGYPVVTSIFLAAALWLGAREHLRLVREFNNGFGEEIKVLSRLLTKRLHDLDEEQDVITKRIIDLERRDDT